LAVLTVAIPLQVSALTEQAEYPVSVTALGSVRWRAPSPLMFSGFGDAFSAIGVAEGSASALQSALGVGLAAFVLGRGCGARVGVAWGWVWASLGWGIGLGVRDWLGLGRPRTRSPASDSG